jgi:CheY-like chemotaxis protein
MFLREPLFVANRPALTHSIVLVEHHLAGVDFLMRMIEIATSYPVVHASTSLQALQAVRTCKPRLLLLNDELPDRTGLEFCQQLRANNEPVRIPIILFTFTALSANMPEYPFTPMRKPFQLVEKVKETSSLSRTALIWTVMVSLLQDRPIHSRVFQQTVTLLRRLYVTIKLR